MNYRYFILSISILFFMSSCYKDANSNTLIVSFHSYTEDSIEYQLIDDTGNQFDEWRDTVYMHVISNNKYENSDYIIELSENPIREQFLKNQQYTIKMNLHLLDEYATSQHPVIYSSSISFFN
jgi:hypothetical protein